VTPGTLAQTFGFGANATVQAEVSGATPDASLVVGAQGPSLAGVQVGTVNAQYCYLAFATGAAPPGRMNFVLAPHAAAPKP